ncbi:MAG: signal peptidase I [Roseiflexaceae bacterium]|nr:signal peptidase I [Roseiflexaceae bacterium]
MFGLLVAVLVIAGMWKLFTKAGKPGWAAIIPIYNIVVLLQIAGKPLWWIVLLFIPFVNFIAIIMIWAAVAKSFGKGIGFTLGLVFLSPIFVPVLGFGGANYVGSAT